MAILALPVFQWFLGLTKAVGAASAVGDNTSNPLKRTVGTTSSRISALNDRTEIKKAGRSGNSNDRFFFLSLHSNPRLLCEHPRTADRPW